MKLKAWVGQLFGESQLANASSEPSSSAPTPLLESLQSNLAQIRQALGDSGDIVIREFKAGKTQGIPAALIYTDGLTDSAKVQDMVMRPLMLATDEHIDLRNETTERVKNQLLTIGDVTDIDQFQTLYGSLLAGDTVILFEGAATALALDARGWKERSVDEPTTQATIRGPKEGFTETIKTNIGLLRRKIKSTDMRIELQKIGRLSQTDVALVYINGLAEESVLGQLRHRLKHIDIDAVFESGNIEEFIQDDTISFFPTILNTERPDVIAAGLVEGRVAIIVDGTPFVLLVPALFTHFMQSPDDYYQRADIATLIRMLRLIAFFLALLAPSIYIAITSFHQEMLPSPLLISLTAARSGVPFPVFVEAFVMELTFELLREAGLRMPKAIGQAISIVGALVLGEAAVQAGLVSPAMVIVVSLTAITTFVIPSISLAVPIRILRFMLMGLSAMFGLYGIFIGIVYIMLHLNTLRSFGVPYLKPYAPFVLGDQKDGVLFRVPVWAMFLRSFAVAKRNIVRQRPQQTRERGEG
ncbi:spore germination protein [Paenibacillus soyae]|uniref:Spore germination protein n=1 Tax=Paenibacillus soyae TaxID=2969249 RepID=A0A9X2MWD5_9BACL|nr:spore germination protein [Paenibacillus soyae]MCR2807108.1 spore germination protein [Paenibacillus soyae]